MMNDTNDYKYCIECGSKMYPMTVNRSFKMKDDTVVTFDNIPAYVCSNKECNEEVYTSETVKMIEEEIIKHRGGK